MKILVTGGAGFIGSAVVRHIISETQDSVVNVDKLTYAGNLNSLRSVSGDSRYAFENLDICDSQAMKDVFLKHQPDAVMHLAAESHVDRSIDGPAAFIETNIVGTYTLLEVAVVGLFSYFYSLLIICSQFSTFGLHYSAYWKRQEIIGRIYLILKNRGFVFIIFQRMKFTAI